MRHTGEQYFFIGIGDVKSFPQIAHGRGWERGDRGASVMSVPH